jgi:hypothetical protein
VEERKTGRESKRERERERERDWICFYPHQTLPVPPCMDSPSRPGSEDYIASMEKQTNKTKH